MFLATSIQNEQNIDLLSISHVWDISEMQVRVDGSERLQRSPVSQLGARLLRCSLLLPTVQEHRRT